MVEIWTPKNVIGVDQWALYDPSADEAPVRRTSFGRVQLPWRAIGQKTLLDHCSVEPHAFSISKTVHDLHYMRVLKRAHATPEGRRRFGERQEVVARRRLARRREHEPSPEHC